MKMTIATALNTALHQRMAEDERIFVMGEDIGGNTSDGIFGVTSGLSAIYGDSRVIETPISEMAFLGAAVGAAMTGMRPVVEIMFCDFLGVCLEQLMNQAAKADFLSNSHQKVPLVLRTTMGAGDGSGAMHSQSLHGLIAQIAGLKIVAPSTAADAAGLLKSAIDDDGPVVIFEHKGLYGLESEVAKDLPPIPLGSGRIHRAGSDITVVAVSAMVHQASIAAERLASDGINIEIIDPRTISPLDLDMILTSVRKTGRLLVVDEGAAFCGFASEVVALVARHGFTSLKAAPQILTPPHTPVPYASALEAQWLVDSDDIVKRVKGIYHAAD